jgi:streptogramin lyase
MVSRSSDVLHIFVLGFCLLVWPHIAISSPTTLPAVEPIAKCGPGKAAGTFHMVYRAQIKLLVPGSTASTVSVTDSIGNEVLVSSIGNATQLAIEADLVPGSYYVTVAPANTENSKYWPSGSHPFFIDKHGQLYLPNEVGITPDVFELEGRIDGISPARNAIASEASPLLKWNGVPGVSHYRGYCPSQTGLRWFDVEEPQYCIPEAVPPGQMCAWHLEARTDEGKTIAHADSAFYSLGTKEADTRPSRWAMTRPIAMKPQPAPKYRLGIKLDPFGIQVPADPAKGRDFSPDGSGELHEGSDYLPGIEVKGIFPGSPALDADLHPGDVIVAVDGKPVPVGQMMMAWGDPNAFTDQINAAEPGQQVSLTVYRFPRKLTIPVTLGGTPSGNPPKIARTTPTTPQTAKLEAAASETLVLSDAPAASPYVTPLTIDPKAEVVTITEPRGLGDGNIAKMVELPNGAMAFATDSGLSIWDGKQVRTFTGVRYVPMSRQPIPGNSALPSNWVQDLLLDSRGRLWIATQGGVCRIDFTNGERWKVQQALSPTLLNRFPQATPTSVTTMFERADGSIVFGGYHDAIWILDPKTDKASLLQSDNETNHIVSGIAEDASHRLWFSVRGLGLFRYDGQKVERILATDKLISAAEMSSMCFDRAGNLWLSGGEKGVAILHPDGTSEKVADNLLPRGFAGQLSLDRSGRLWVSTEGGFAVHTPSESGKDSEGWSYLATGSRYGMQQILLAKDGSLWIGTSPLTRRAKWTLSSRNPLTEEIESFKAAIEKAYPNVTVNSFTAVSGNLVVGAAGEKLFRYDGKTWDDLSEKLGRIDISQMLTDSHGTIWVATSGQGLIGINASGITRQNNDPEDGKCMVYCLANAPDGTMYAGTGNGSYRLTGEKWGKIETDEAVYQVTTIVTDRRSRAWMFDVTYGNVFVFDGKHIHNIKSQTTIEDKAVENLRMDDAGNILVDIPAEPDRKAPVRTFKWDANVDGKIGPPVEVR